MDRRHTASLPSRPPTAGRDAASTSDRAGGETPVLVDAVPHPVAGWRSHRPAPGGELPLMRSPLAGAGWCAGEKGTASQGARLGRAWQRSVCTWRGPAD